MSAESCEKVLFFIYSKPLDECVIKDPFSYFSTKTYVGHSKEPSA